MAASSCSAWRAACSLCTMSEVRVNRTRNPFSTSARPIADAQWLFPAPGGPNSNKLVALSSQVSPAARAMTRALLSIGTTEKSKLSSVLPGSRRASARLRRIRRCPRSAISSSARAARKRAAGQLSLSARSLNSGQSRAIAGRCSSLSSNGSRLVSTSILLMTAPIRGAPGAGRHRSRGNGNRDLGQGDGLRREAVLQSEQIGQNPGIEKRPQFAGQFGLTGPVVSQSKQTDHGAAGVASGSGGKQGLPGIAERFAREQLVAISEVEQRHRLAAQGVNDVVIIDHVAVAVAGEPSAPRECQHQTAAKEAFQPVVIEAHAQTV